MTPPGNLICTVGTSLFLSNLKFLNPQTKYQKPPVEHDSAAQADWTALEKNGFLENPEKLKNLMFDVRSAYNNKDYSRIAVLFTSLPPELRLLGAEINSVEAMVRKKFTPENRLRIILLVSDTHEGQAIGNILKLYFLHPTCPIAFEKCIVETVIGLQDENPPMFQKDGLPNLVRLLGNHYRQWGGAVAINATGGYKAQIALAVAFGQAVGTPVYYKHERFDQIIRFPEVPFTLDLSMVEKNLKLWADMAEPGASFDQITVHKKIGLDDKLQESFLPLLEWVEEDNSKLFSLSALGMVYWEAFRSLNPNIALKPARVKERKGCHFRDDHYPKAFIQHVKKFYSTFPEYISECHSLPYSGQKAIKNRFYTNENRIIGEYLDRNHFGGRFEIMNTSENELERQWLLNHFNEWLEH